ncbi:hypothetical protein PSMK_19990 [Phycisphaera mikurensis NBRC 102666]|uniref:Uncharacterized protein n=1 Tax=Phycisphaera mikurensis (strain NBRC 102666 / KCTC 22515 / FYK2301M01) TaxID=1142394 RepID=I0IFX0_PHYMF|nr:hypothetical protein PSMK_19990 [Phycisphaera mikurensis NBRC 102666]
MKIPLVQQHNGHRVLSWSGVGLVWLFVAFIATGAAAAMSWLLGWYSSALFAITLLVLPLFMVSLGVWSGLTCAVSKLHPRPPRAA